MLSCTILQSRRWYEENHDSKDVIKEKGFVIINAKDNILGTVAGTLASILSHLNDFEQGTLIMSLARVIDNYTKVSLRVAGKNNDNKDLNEIIREIIEGIPDCEAGGHCDAAGAIIPTSKEKEFIEKARITLKKRSIEENVV